MKTINKIAALCTGLLLTIGLGASGATIAYANSNPNAGEKVCEDLDTGHLSGGSGNTFIYTAPAGKLVDYYCVKAGSSNQGEGNGPVIVEVNPNVATVTIDHPVRDSISHFSVKWVDAEAPTTVGINLTYIMDCAPDPMNTWRVRNPHTETITVTWRNAVNTLSGTHTATPGDSFFETPRGTETMIISWGGGTTGIVAGSVTKASGNDVSASDPKCLPPAEQCVVTYGDWFTENDDTVPTVEENGLRFVGGVNDSMGTGIGIGGNLQGLPEITYVAEGDAYSLARFYPRIVINSSADGGPSYNSITVTSEGPVNSASVASGRVKTAEGNFRVSKTIAEWIAYYPNNELRAFFFNTDSSSNSDVSVLLKSVTAGECFSKAWGYGPQPEDKVVKGEWMTGEYDCDDTTVVETRTVTTTPYKLVDNKWVLDTENATTETETNTRALTEQEIDALFCPGPQPEDKVEYGDWVDGQYDCGDTTVEQTRTKTTTSFILEGEEWVEGSSSQVIETQTRPLTEQEISALDCSVPDTLAETGFNARGVLIASILGLVLAAVGVLALLWKRHNERS